MRTLLTPRWAGLTAVALLAVVMCVALARWQWDRTQDQLDAEAAALAEPAPVSEVAPANGSPIPPEALGRQVVVTGEFVPGATSSIRSRLSDDDQPGYWLVAGVRTPERSVVPVLLGWSRTADVDPPHGPVTVLGRLQPSENFYPDAPKRVKGPLLTITGEGLERQWEGELDSRELSAGFVTTTDSRPSIRGVQLVRPVIGTDPELGLPLQNIFYSLQWLVFAGFALYMWARWLREDLTAARAAGGIQRGATPVGPSGSART